MEPFVLSVSEPVSDDFQGRDFALMSGRVSRIALAQMDTDVTQWETPQTPVQGKPAGPADYWQIVLQMKVNDSLPWASHFVAKPNQIQWLENYSWRHSGTAGGADEQTARTAIVKEPPLAIGDIADSHSGNPSSSYQRFVWRIPGVREIPVFTDVRYRFRLERVASAPASLQLADIGTGTFKVGIAG